MDCERPCDSCGLVGPHICRPSHRDRTVTAADRAALETELLDSDPFGITHDMDGNRRDA